MSEAQAAVEENVEVTLEDDKKAVQTEEAVEQEPQAKESSDDELDNYSRGVQKRIKKLTEKYRYAERDKEEAARLAETLKNENDQLKQKLSNLDQGYISEYGTRIESQVAMAKQAYKDAHDRGDVDAMFEAQQALSKISIEQERYRLAKQRQEAQPVQSAPSQVQPEPAQQVQAAAEPDPKAKKWAETNEWFGEDEIMTQAALIIDKDLRSEGFDGTEDEYYDELNTRIRKRFPNEFGKSNNGGGNRVASANTSASRSGLQGRRTVKLTHSQVAMAKKLGVPLEEYAKYVKD